MIPAEAVEAAAKAIFGVDDATWDLQIQDVRDSYLEDAKNALEAAAPHMLATSPVVTDEMVDAVLEHGGTPRRRLFEYPHRDDDSREMIRSAETLVRRILSMRPTNV